MKLGRLIHLAAFVLVGCSPITTFYKPGVSAARLEADSVQCSVSALRQVPVANKVVQDPPFFVPARTICNNEGRCRTLPGRFIPGQVRTVDANAPYAYASPANAWPRAAIPCNRFHNAPGHPRKLCKCRRSPTLSANSCAVRDANGTLGIGTKK